MIESLINYVLERQIQIYNLLFMNYLFILFYQIYFFQKFLHDINIHAISYIDKSCSIPFFSLNRDQLSYATCDPIDYTHMLVLQREIQKNNPSRNEVDILYFWPKPLYHFFSTKPFLPKNQGPNSITFSMSSLYVKLKDINSLRRVVISACPLAFQFSFIHCLIISILGQIPMNLPIKVYLSLSTFDSMTTLGIIKLTFLSLMMGSILNSASHSIHLGPM